MALESASFIDGLVPSNPTSTDSVSQADDHLRLIKAALKNTFPNLTGPVNTTQAQLNQLTTPLIQIPVGFIGMWSGAINAIPSGWALCNGSNGTPDLRDRFIVGAGSTYTVGATGGANTVTLTESQIPGHTHTGNTGNESASHTHAFSGTTSTNGDHNHTQTNGTGGTSTSGTVGTRSNPGSFPDDQPTSTAGAHNHTFSGTTQTTSNTHTHPFTTNSTGGGQSHENRPPYYALAYIMKL